MKTHEYRIKGLEGLTVPTPKGETSGPSPVEVLEGAGPDTFSLIARTLGFPRITDALYDFDSDALADCCPTFSYFHPRRHFGPIKSEPVRLIKSMYPLSPHDRDGSMYGSLILVRQQSRETTAIRRLLAGEADECFDGVPLAASIAAYLRRGSAWLLENREHLLNIIRRSPEAAFIALASGGWTDEMRILVKAVAASPDLMLQTWRSVILRRQIPESFVMHALSDHPVHRAVAIAMQPRRFQEATECLHLAAATHPHAAAICFAMHPQHAKAEEWLLRARTDGHALHRLGRMWKTRGRKLIDLPRRDDIVCSLLEEDNRAWLYHWARDIQPEEGKRFAAHLWPSAWAVELIEDLKLPRDFVADLLPSMVEDVTTHDSSLHFWATEYCAE